MSQKDQPEGGLGHAGGVHFACPGPVSRVYILSTLRHFDSKLGSRVKTGPLIPCERRLLEIEISENQEVTFEQRFGIRDYERPYAHFLVTLGRFD